MYEKIFTALEKLENFFTELRQIFTVSALVCRTNKLIINVHNRGDSLPVILFAPYTIPTVNMPSSVTTLI
jgi:hypothetical protein